MRKKITKPNTTREKVNVLCLLTNKQLSDTETNILSELIEMSQGNNITLSVQITKQIRDELNISSSLFNTGIHRLEQKKVLNKSGKTIMLSPMFNNISELSEFIVGFTSV